MSALKKIWQDGKLVGVSIEEQSASELAPTQFETEVVRIFDDLAKYQKIVRALRKTFVDIGYKLCVSRIDTHLERLHLVLPDEEESK